MNFPVVISCEHAGYKIPAAFQHLFVQDREVLNTHRGWDSGALPIAQALAQHLQAPLFYEETSRLLIEMNRSQDNPALFSEFSSSLAETFKQQLLEEVYLPYRNRVTTALQACIDRHQKVLHLSVHTFTPILNREIRTTDIGLLFDPNRAEEQKFCEQLSAFLVKHLPERQIDFNQPYKGTDDGFTTFLRKYFPANCYSGIELEINQKYTDRSEMPDIKRFLAEGIRNFLLNYE